MTTIAEKIEDITDTGLFEKIVIAILREKEPDYWNIIHSGVNAKGKPKKSPLDAFHKLPNGDYVLFEITTTDTKSLKNKWLSEKKSKEGDLIKASFEADKLRKTYPKAKFIIWLCVNTQIQNQLSQETEEKAKELSLITRYFDRSAIADYLVNNPNGQWIAEQYLKITAVRLSIGKLKQLTDKINSEFHEEIYYDESKSINREVSKRYLEKIASVNKHFFFLIGDSGLGKSGSINLRVISYNYG